MKTNCNVNYSPATLIRWWCSRWFTGCK